MRRKCRLALLAASTSGLTLLPSLGRAQVEIESFHNFNPDNYYDAWLDPPPFTTITSAPTYWETASTEGYGSCYYGYYTDNGGAHIDATGEGMLQLSFTINSGDAGMFVDMDDGEGDEWQWMMGGFGLTPGTYVIDEPLNDPSLKEMVARSGRHERKPKAVRRVLDRFVGRQSQSDLEQRQLHKPEIPQCDRGRHDLG
jgi:hypothetical protein